MQQQTPGVYINEINAFPNSVVEVATAVPVFIGYTAKANYNGEDLANKPRRVTSLKEFETYFGQGAVPVFDLKERAAITNEVRAALAVQPLALQIHDVTVYGPGPGATALKNYSLVPDDGSIIFYLYNSVRLFYQNGGATCYIVSIGQYDGGDGSDASMEDMASDANGATVKNALGNVTDSTNAPAAKPTKDQFIQAIDSLIYEQEPTMLLCPDALCLNEDEYYTVAQKMLQHCNETQSRVAVLDVYKGAVTNPLDLNGDDTPVSRFREGVTNNYLKYGVSYFPWVHTTVVGDTETTFQNMSKNMVATVNAAANKALLTAQTDALAKMNSPELPAAQQTLRGALAYAKLVQAARRMHGPSQDDVASEDADRIATAPTTAKAATDLATTATTSATAATQAIADAIKDPTTVDPAVVDTAIAKIATAAGDATAAAKALTDMGGTAAGKAAEASTAALSIATSTAAAAKTLTDAAQTAKMKEATDAATKAATAATDSAAAATAAAQAATNAATAAGAAGDAAAAQAAATAATAAIGAAQSEADAKKKTALTTTAVTAAGAAATAATKAAKSATAAAGAAGGPATVNDLAAAATDAAKKATDAATAAGTGADDAAKATSAQAAAEAAQDAADRAASVVTALSGQPLTPAEKQTEVIRLHSALLASNLDYARVIDNITRYRNTLPVAPAMAGVYTAVDTNRGVWKAPANVGLSGVIAPTVNLSDNDQARLNVDAVSGKSINAIRPFPGQGVMVWGGRTLDGNSQDWRFINVRRTMIMLEQSIKLAARAYVFEPNDANTWVTVQSMISNFLFNLWKQGALAGSKPDDAYSVAVGLGTTMTAQDILDGYMNVFVKVAISRPAEFIVLNFQQQMQKS